MGFFVVIVWIVSSFAVATWATRRGRDPVGWGLFALILSPLLAGLLLFILPDIAEILAQKEKTMQEAQALQKEKLKISGETLASSITQLHRLLEKGIITDAEYEFKKGLAISDLKQKIIKESQEDFLEALIPLFEENIVSSDDIGAIKTALEKNINNNNVCCSYCREIVANDSCFCPNCGRPIQDPKLQQTASEMLTEDNSSKSSDRIAIILISLFVLLISIVLFPIAVVPLSIVAMIIYFLKYRGASVNKVDK